MICSDIWHKYHSGYFKIVSNFTCLTAREITYNNFEISFVVFMPNITTNPAITYTNHFKFQIFNHFTFQVLGNVFTKGIILFQSMIRRDKIWGKYSKKNLKV